ncbi:hypothetical protein QT13_21045 [Pectobacterium brasiliense]|nr:hypothetical protein QT13_21045 [Pectobacterium brasiliense]
MTHWDWLALFVELDIRGIKNIDLKDIQHRMLLNYQNHILTQLGAHLMLKARLMRCGVQPSKQMVMSMIQIQVKN